MPITAITIENTEQEEICLRLPTISLFPPEVTEEMEQRFPKRLARLDETGRLAIATVILEGRITNERLQELTDRHPRDITFLLKSLVEQRFLVVNEKRRWSTYSLTPEDTASGPDSSRHKEPSYHHKEPSYHQSEEAPAITAEILPPLVQEIRGQQRSRSQKIEEAILALCADRYVTAQELAEILQRSIENMKNHYIARLVRQGRLKLRFPGQPTHPAQAYRTSAAEITTSDDGRKRPAQ